MRYEYGLNDYGAYIRRQFVRTVAKCEMTMVNRMERRKGAGDSIHMHAHNHTHMLDVQIELR